MSFSTISVLFLFALACSSTVLAHSWMSHPEPYDPREFSCNEGEPCNDACPRRSPDSAIDRENPSAEWRRGDSVRLAWTRNNHDGGFIRISLVPVQHIFDRDIHMKYTLFHGCWETGEHSCARDEDCGVDNTNIAFETMMTVPDVYPDGDYVLGYVWYGGLRPDRRFGQFKNYYSCTHVRISGGVPLGDSYQAFFESGGGSRTRNDMCQTSAITVGQCELGCPGRRSTFSTPRVIRRGELAPITPADLIADGAPAPEDEEGGGDMMPGEDPDLDRGICVGRICCASECGRCRGRGCNRLPGGSANCCRGRIRRNGVSCSNTQGAPCVRPRN